jgi:hypothetical protein
LTLFLFFIFVFFYSLGKTIQAIALIWTLLKQGPNGQPAAKKAIVVTPASLIDVLPSPPSSLPHHLC